MRDASGPKVSDRGEASLEKRLGLVHVYAIATGAMFSSGFFLLPGLAADEAGPSVTVAYLLAGVLVVPATLSVAELSTAMPRAGGPFFFLRRSLGPLAATVGGIGLWVALVTKSAFALVGMGAYLSLAVDIPIMPVALGLAVAFGVLNVVGAEVGARVEVVLVAVLLFVLGLYLVAGGWEVASGEPLEQFRPFAPGGAVGILAATSLVFVSFAGLNQVASVAGEVERPQRAIPLGLMLALGSTTVVYVLGVAIMVGTVEPDALRDSETPVAAAAEQIGLPWSVGLIVAAAIAAFASTANAGIMAAARYPLAMAREGFVWRPFGRLSPMGTPWVAIAITAGAVASMIAVLEAEQIAKLASAFILFIFGLLNLAVLVLRRARLVDYRPTFRAPLSPWLQIVGIGVSVTLLANVGMVSLASMIVVILAASAWYALSARHRASAVGAATMILRRRRGGPVLRLDREQLDALAEEGTRDDDRYEDLLLEAVMVEGTAGASEEELRSALVEALAPRLDTSPERLRRWVASAGTTVHPVEGITVLSLLLDSPTPPSIALAWSSSDQVGVRAVALVIGDVAGRARLDRVIGHIVVQCADESVRADWQEAEGADAVRSVLVDDARRRRGVRTES